MYSRRKFIGAGCSLIALNGVFMGSIMANNPDATCMFDPGVSDKKRLADYMGGQKPLIWLFTGDSITMGAKHTHGFRSFPEIFAERIRWGMGRGRDIIINTAVSGNTSKNILDDFDWRVKQFSPAVVSLMIGTNDCALAKGINPQQFRANLKLLIDRIRKMKAIPVLHTPNVIIAGKAKERSALPEYISVINEVANELGVIIVDNWGYWKQSIAAASAQQIFREWLNDPLHPNGEGHKEIAWLMFKELSMFDPKDSTCGGAYYEGEH